MLLSTIENSQRTIIQQHTMCVKIKYAAVGNLVVSSVFIIMPIDQTKTKRLEGNFLV